MSLAPRHNGGPAIIDVHPDDRMIYAQWHLKDYLQGVQRLKPDQVGIYSILLCLIYENMGKLRDNDMFISGHCQCGVRYYRKIKDSLVADGKIYLFDGFIYNDRAIAEIAKFCKAMQERREENENKRQAALLREQRKREAAEQEAGHGAAQDARRAPDASTIGTREVHDRCTTGARQVPVACTTGNQKTEKHNEIKGRHTAAVPPDCPKTREEEEEDKTRKKETTTAVPPEPPPTPPRGPPPLRRDVVVALLADWLGHAKHESDRLVRAETWLSNQINMAGESAVLEAVRITASKIDSGELIAKRIAHVSQIIHKLIAEQHSGKGSAPRQFPDGTKRLDLNALPIVPSPPEAYR